MAIQKQFVVEKVSQSEYKVVSHSEGESPASYTVTIDGNGVKSCVCPGFKHYKECRHIAKVTHLESVTVVAADRTKAAEIVQWVSQTLKPFVSNIAVDDLLKDARGDVTTIQMTALVTPTRDGTEKRLLVVKSGVRVEVRFK